MCSCNSYYAANTAHNRTSAPGNICVAVIAIMLLIQHNRTSAPGNIYVAVIAIMLLIQRITEPVLLEIYV